MTVTDVMGNTRNVITHNGMYNVQAREYWLNSTNVNNAQTLTNSSTAVVHAIDGPLFFDKDQFTYIPRQIIAESF